MRLELFRHLWGLDDALPAAIPGIKAFGYTGIEAGLGHVPSRKGLRETLAEHDLRFIAMIFTAGSNVREHLRSFREQIDEAVTFSPVKITSHSGRDEFSEVQSVEFFREAAKIEASVGVPVVHETHRGRILFHPWITRAVLDAVPEVSLCMDLSHWVCVCERLPEAEDEIIRLAASRTQHVHARVGYEQGPQVPDPRAPEYARHLAAHERWWDIVWDSQAQDGTSVSTLTPEFGPPPYLHTQPFTNQPVAALRETCDWQAARQLERFSQRFSQSV